MIHFAAEISMLIVTDKKIPEPAKERLSAYGKLIEFETTDITYHAISGHPDIFFCVTKNAIITAPNTPENYINLLHDKKLFFTTGYKAVGETYPQSALYNAVITENFLIHSLEITDDCIIRNCNNLEKIDVRQGYTRCSLLEFNDNFITSDQGIYKTLKKRGLKILYVQPDDVLLPGYPHGFFGGACGRNKDKIFIIGSLKYLKDGDIVRGFINSAGFEIVELYEGPLFDGGSILFISTN